MQWIFATDGRPFRDRDAAVIKRELIAAELGTAVKLDVVSHPDGGYAVACARRDASSPADARDAEHKGRGTVPRMLADPTSSESPREELVRALRAIPATAASPSSSPVSANPLQARLGTDHRSASEHTSLSASRASAPKGAYPDVFRLSPAPRAFIGQHVLAFLGALLLLLPHELLRLTGLGVPENPSLGALALGSVALGGALLAVVSLSRFLWAYTANTYVVDGSGVEQIEWYWDRGRLRRRAPRVNFAHLRTADVDQSLTQMLLNVGSLKLAAGGTDTYEVVLRHVLAPRRLQAEFQRRLRLTNDGLLRGTLVQRQADL